MAGDDPWRQLHADRFPDLQFDCGKTTNPGVRYSEHLRDWSDKPTTPDQLRMERYIDRFDLRTKRVLHIGIGNSGLAMRFHRRVKAIVGTTIDDSEMRVARRLSLPNYWVVKHNKFSGAEAVPPEKVDFILDNNPTSPCCCITHLRTLFRFYDSRLADGGQIVTDQQGLGWVPDGFNARWGFDFDDLTAVAAIAGFKAYRANRHVYILSRTPPPAPGALPLLRHAMREAKSAPRGVSKLGKRILRRIAASVTSRLTLR